MRIYFIFICLLLNTLSCDQELTTSPSEIPPPRGFLVIESKPAGYQIWVDGKNTGRKTPDSILWIEPKEYEITLRKYRWKDTSFVMRAEEDVLVDTTINYLLNPSMYGMIRFTADPNYVNIFMNDSLINVETPFTIDHILPGEYKITYTAPSHRSIEFFAEVFSNKITSAYRRLRDTTLWVDYQTYNSLIPTDHLTAITVDKNNTKWISTAEFGLLKFNGSKFEIINSSNSELPSNTIFTIAVDGENKKWVGTNKGFAIFDDLGNWQFYSMSNSELTSNNITSFEFNNSDNSVLIGSTNNVIKMKDGHFFTYKIVSDTQEPISVTDILLTTEFNKFWIGTSAYGIYEFNGKQLSELVNWEKNPLVPELLNNAPTRNITRILYDKSNLIWVTSNYDIAEIPIGGRWVVYHKKGGVSLFDGSKWTGDMFLLAGVSSSDLFIDENNVKWVATDQGLYRYESISEKIWFRSEFNGLSSDKISGVVMDKESILWISTYDRGLNKYKGETP